MSQRVSVLIPSRNEKYLIQTVDNVLSQARGEVEVVVVLEDFGKQGITPTADEWVRVVDRHQPRLHTIYHHEAKGMRPAINAAAASAISRGAKYLAKFDAHCAFGEGWDLELAKECDDDWIVVPRRLRLDPDTFAPRNDGRPPIDYHYLSFPDDVNDFGGPGLNGKVWAERQRERAAVEVDDEMSSQGSGWFMHASYFQRCGFMDDASYGPFWNEFQELGLTCWLSGGQVKVNKRTWYAHWHKGSAGRGYHMPKEWTNTGARFTKRWLFNEASSLQTRPFNWLIQHFWPVPTWPENWEELVYAGPNRSKIALPSQAKEVTTDGEKAGAETPSLRVISAFYGPTGTELDVSEVLRSKIANDSLDLNVTNGELQVGNPFRGIKKLLTVTYSYDGQPPTTITKDEREWLIIGQSARWVKQVVPDSEGRRIGDRFAENRFVNQLIEVVHETQRQDIPHSSVGDNPDVSGTGQLVSVPKMSSQALTDFLIRRFQIPSHRLRGPMPIELRDFHRDDLAQLFAELGFNRGAEIGVAEGKYSEVLVKANPELELYCVDPWHAYDGNKQQKSHEKHVYAFNETSRRIQGSKARLIAKTSMDAVRDIPDEYLDFCYIDANHSFDFVLMDLIEWSKRVRSGGIVAGDDFYYLDPKRWGAGPVEAVRAYTEAHQINPWFICNAHKSIDYFWVKQ